ncbi:MAG TPA: gluconate 2-dehydrogenase subunit 3 family protein [Terracidiphilus sp.]|nr:gluconate 2-dehydrogenase subunit 3 family protein [Terracidiphilus sp.]
MKEPRERNAGTSEDHGIMQRAHPGYYPGYSTLSQQNYWDEATRTAVVRRVEETEPIRFFSPDEVKTLQAIIDRLLPQDDRIPDRRIPILPTIDARLYKNKLNGYRYEEMPPDQDVYRMALKAIDEMAQKSFGSRFAELMVLHQELILKSLHDGKPDPPHKIWKQMPVKRLWELLMDDCVSAYYAHPWAWDEIGYGGPAYPRGYMRLENGMREPWEVDEERYEWSAPQDSLSDLKLADLARKSEPTSEPRSSR